MATGHLGRLLPSHRQTAVYCETASEPVPYRTTQHPLPSPFSNVRRAARVAASKTSSTPSPLKLEHSRYRFAPTSRAANSPSCGVRNRWDFLRISSIATGSSRRSFFSPTKIRGTPAHSRLASSIHYATKVPVSHHLCFGTKRRLVRVPCS
jgi:hypothetical protein